MLLRGINTILVTIFAVIFVTGCNREMADLVSFSEDSHDFGVVLDESVDVLTGSFTIENISRKEIAKIAGISATCGCIITELENIDLQPGEDVQIDFTLNIGGNWVGRKSEQIAVVFRDKSSRLLTVSAFVEARVKTVPEKLVFQTSTGRVEIDIFKSYVNRSRNSITGNLIESTSLGIPGSRCQVIEGQRKSNLETIEDEKTLANRSKTTLMVALSSDHSGKRVKGDLRVKFSDGYVMDREVEIFYREPIPFKTPVLQLGKDTIVTTRDVQAVDVSSIKLGMEKIKFEVIDSDEIRIFFGESVVSADQFGMIAGVVSLRNGREIPFKWHVERD